MPNGLIDSKSDVHEIQIQSIQIRNTRQTDKYNIKVDITAKHLCICVFVYLCICVLKGMGTVSYTHLTLPTKA